MAKYNHTTMVALKYVRVANLVPGILINLSRIGNAVFFNLYIQ